MMPRQAEQIRALMHQRHHITPPQEDDFRIVSPMVIAAMVRGTSGTISMLLVALAALSLLVGGVVLMNILLISVAERTGEIGLRRALGATRRDIFVQFLTESLAVTLIGMILGSLLGFGCQRLAAPLHADHGDRLVGAARAGAGLRAVWSGRSSASSRHAGRRRLRPVEALR